MASSLAIQCISLQLISLRVHSRHPSPRPHQPFSPAWRSHVIPTYDFVFSSPEPECYSFTLLIRSGTCTPSFCLDHHSDLLHLQDKGPAPCVTFEVCPCCLGTRALCTQPPSGPPPFPRLAILPPPRRLWMASLPVWSAPHSLPRWCAFRSHLTY